MFLSGNQSVAFDVTESSGKTADILDKARQYASNRRWPRLAK